MRQCFQCKREDVEFTKGCTYCKSCESIRWKIRYAKQKEAYAKRKMIKYEKEFSHECLECKKKFIGRSDFCSVPCKLYNGIEKKNGCWLWKRTITPNGYGSLGINGKTTEAHRVSYRFFKGPIEKGKYVCHTCDIRNCINPDHLFLGTAKENMIDASKKGRLNPSYSKLNVEKVRLIRSLRRNGVNIKKISEILNIDEPTVTEVYYGKSWRSVE